MIKRSTGITLFLLGSGSLAMYAAARPEECRPRTGLGVTQGWHPHATETTLECRRPPSDRSSSRSHGSSRSWGSGSSGSSNNVGVPGPQTASRGGFGSSGALHSFGG